MSETEDKNRIASLAARAMLNHNFALKLLNANFRAEALTDPKKRQPKWGLHPKLVTALLGLPNFDTPEDFLEAASKVVDQVGKLE